LENFLPVLDGTELAMEINRGKSGGPDWQSLEPREVAMALYRRIMVAVDFSIYSGKAVAQGVALAREAGATLILVNVINQRDVNAIEKALAGQSEFSVEDYLAQQRKDRSARLRELVVEAGGEDLPVEGVVVAGVPYLALLEQIDAQRAELLIMSTKGRSNLADTVIGSCAQKMYRRCPVPLLSLRPEKKI
jgi:nucleotide-binding universal stress UspA family protein